MAHTEADRIAFNNDLVERANAHKKVEWDRRIQIWLDHNPRVGSLNDGMGGVKYYITNGVGETIAVNPLQIIR